jgi:hypothetical protein
MHANPSSSLLDIAHLIDDAFVGSGPDLAFHVAADPDDPDVVVLGLLPLREHPCTAFAGLVAPSDWWAFGIRVQSTAHFLDRPDRPAESVVTTFVCDRTGASASLLRRAGAEAEETHLVEGRVPDLCRRILSPEGASAPP